MLEGQWLGDDKGTNPGSLWLELDRINGQISGWGMRMEMEPGIPGTLVEVRLEDKEKPQTIEVQTQPLDTSCGRILRREEAKQFFPDSTPARTATITVSLLDEKTMKVSWKSDIDTEGTALLTKAEVRQTSQVRVHPEVTSWPRFKEEILQPTYQNRLFRGQSKPWPLQTSFHRTRRSDLSRYIFDDMAELYRRLSGELLPVRFDRNDPQQNESFIALAQHHGFPTPTIDWSKSPFVAMYFALQDALKAPDQGPTNLRIFCLDYHALPQEIKSSQCFTRTGPHLTGINALPIANRRLLPQQGILTSTNLRDIEGFLIYLERRNQKYFLTAFDIQIPEPAAVMRELRMMGVTASALFPGLDGICEDMRSEYFLESR